MSGTGYTQKVLCREVRKKSGWKCSIVVLEKTKQTNKQNKIKGGLGKRNEATRYKVKIPQVDVVESSQHGGSKMTLVLSL